MQSLRDAARKSGPRHRGRKPGPPVGAFGSCHDGRKAHLSACARFERMATY
jgi:hypothetical protein